jgi:hypothetical protein
VGPRAGLDAAEKRKFLTLPGLELQPLGGPARSQSLYRLHYPDSFTSADNKFYSDGTCFERIAMPRIIRGGGILYSDTQHLSLTGPCYLSH